MTGSWGLRILTADVLDFGFTLEKDNFLQFQASVSCSVQIQCFLRLKCLTIHRNGTDCCSRRPYCRSLIAGTTSALAWWVHS